MTDLFQVFLLAREEGNKSGNSVNTNLLKVRAEFVVVVFIYFLECTLIKKRTMKYGNIRLFKAGRRDS